MHCVYKPIIAFGCSWDAMYGVINRIQPLLHSITYTHMVRPFALCLHTNDVCAQIWLKHQTAMTNVHTQLQGSFSVSSVMKAEETEKHSLQTPHQCIHTAIHFKYCTINLASHLCTYCQYY